MANSAPEPVLPEETASAAVPASIVAAAGSIGLDSGELQMEDVIKGLQAQFNRFPNVGNAPSRRTERFGVAKLQKGMTEENEKFSTGNRSDYDSDFSMIQDLIRESRLPGGSLVAEGTKFSASLAGHRSTTSAWRAAPAA